MVPARLNSDGSGKARTLAQRAILYLVSRLLQGVLHKDVRFRNSSTLIQQEEMCPTHWPLTSRRAAVFFWKGSSANCIANTQSQGNIFFTHQMDYIQIC